MANEFEDIKGEVFQELRIEIDAGIGCMGSNSDPDTDIDVKPPLNGTEHEKLVERLDPESQLGALIVSAQEVTGEWPRFTADGEPSQEHVDLGIELAHEMINLRGLRAGKVVAAIDNKLQTYFVRKKSQAELLAEDTWIGGADDEFEAGVKADKNDPVWQAILKKAGVAGKRQTMINYLREHADQVLLVKADDRTAVLRSPATGYLYAVSLDYGSNGEEVNVTELVELQDEGQRE